ncbi:MAG: hypothetical protein GAK30_02093 [Paracidovorax wautersii]|uniref:Uncharacterized protein n=1 Tax=Paracidovorax wautersii TaxID=1177982 RepID=A0A7V8FNN3_9BURK|nr:MAG: hypothetical protein GAK30_02093 [Paracidovorax wautersii]
MESRTGGHAGPGCIAQTLAWARGGRSGEKKDGGADRAAGRLDPCFSPGGAASAWALPGGNAMPQANGVKVSAR